MSPNMANSSLDSKTDDGKPTSPREPTKESTILGKHFLYVRNNTSYQKLEDRVAIARGVLACRSWLEALPITERQLGQNHALDLMEGKIPQPAESMGREICSAARLLTHEGGQTAQGEKDAAADEYARALAWANQRMEEHKRIERVGPPVESKLFEMGTGYIVEFSVGKKLIEQRHFVEDVVDDICGDDTSVDPEELRFLAARHSSKQCFVCEKLGA